MIEYNAAMVITAIKLNEELHLKSLGDWRFFYKIISGLLPSYLYEYPISCNDERTYSIHSSTQKKLKTFSARTRLFETSFFLHWAEEWRKPSKKIRNIYLV